MLKAEKPSLPDEKSMPDSISTGIDAARICALNEALSSTIGGDAAFHLSVALVSGQEFDVCQAQQGVQRLNADQ